jgi:putative tryptophan/tyrosine transport system substrate-binding protein
MLMTRRDVIALLGMAAAWPTAARAQAAQARRVGILVTSTASDTGNTRWWQALESDLRERGWEEGRNIEFVRRFAGGDPARFPDIAAELVALKVDAILVSNTQAAVAARSKTTTIPIVMVGLADPVGSGLVTSLARPGGNVTGLSNQIDTVTEKNFELLKETRPGIKRIGILFSPSNAPSAKTARAMQEQAGPRLGLTVVPVGLTKPEDLAGAFEMITREQLEALVVLPVPVVFASRGKILDFTLQQRLPALGLTSDYVREGFLMSYGFDVQATWARAGSYVDRILRGANPAELPVEQVDRFLLVINQKTARAIGFDTISLLSRADEVIE